MVTKMSSLSASHDGERRGLCLTAIGIRGGGRHDRFRVYFLAGLPFGLARPSRCLYIKGAKVDTDQELFRVQCRVLALGTDTRLTAKQLRDELMQLREEIMQRRAKLAKKMEREKCDVEVSLPLR